MTTRRTFLATGAATLGAVTVLPFAARAAGEADRYPVDGGEIVVHPVSHASLVLETPAGTIYVDPVGEPSAYDDFPAPDLILITHEHGDHYAVDTLQALTEMRTQILANPAVYDMLPQELKAQAVKIANGGTTEMLGLPIEAVPAYNLTEGRLDFHPEGRDNGYVLTIGGRRVYISGDTEGTPEMRALEDIHIAFVSMNLPFTMDAEQAADAVAAFQPDYVYPYHYRGRDGGTQDPAEFARLLGEADAETEVRMGEWYPGGLEG
ncbi:MBL fold metallo-hydrolase [Palleronia sediminis]|uniref:MBL fold metallo-hydrolase n=1 Tax=Palleronia sediminis TaxID=2547833 RepID=A0A4R6ABX7_9RHOB|nr:MBL fold metallo-hydrolase [Palleronia sediminis]TDL81320.1 MBL fold metallo-hydrolase [Palleronia sediminis]